MAEPQERGQFILDLDLNSGGHRFLRENSLNGLWVWLGNGSGGVCVCVYVCVFWGGKVSGVKSGCHPVFVSFDPFKHC